MRRIPSFLLFSAIVLAAGFAAPSAGVCADEDDHDQARTALQQRKALPLADILKKIRPQLQGRIVGTELEREGDLYIYEFKTVTPDGRLQELYVNARTGKILKEGGTD